MPVPPPLVVFCHLRWDFVFQRPQHLMTRLARTRPVYFIEEPVYDPGTPHWQTREASPGLTVCRPHTPVEAGGFGDHQAAHLAPLVHDLLKEHAGAGYDVWLYTPMALPLLAGLKPRVVAYDCMDELSAFKFAPPQLLELETRLLERADVVFTGGPSLYRAKKGRHTNCYCFPSSVDARHFGTVPPEPAGQADIPRPRLGFYGVIDERFDLDLLAAAASERPDWQFVIVGPVVKIDPADLPRNANIHYLGQQAYEALPAYLAGWDVALLPFARNESTKFISPTKTVEYMAAGKPVVSTRIPDVAEPYGSMIGLADTAAEFVAACERALNETADDKARRLEQYRGVLAKTSWDATATLMGDLLDECGTRNESGEGARASASPVVVIGAGPTGLSAAYHLGEDALLIEANDSVGGWCRSLTDNGFTFDMAGHIMFSNDPYVHEMYRVLLGDNVHWQDREAWIYSKDVYTRYPFQGSLYGLPADVIKECVVGAIEARFGSLAKKPDPKPAPTANGYGKSHANGKSPVSQAVKDAARNLSASTDPKDAVVSDCCADGVAENTAPLVERDGKSGPRNFAEFIDQVWGAGIAKHFAVPYNRKIWAVPLETMETSWLGGRVPMPDLGEMIEGALTQKPKPMGPNARFGYPLRGGFQALMDGFLPKLRGELRLDTRVKAVSPSRRVVTTTTGEEIGYDRLVSTMPLPVLIRAMGSEVPADVRAAAEALRFTSVRCVNLGVGRASVTEKHWIYYPEDTVFHRIFVQGNASPHCNPPGGFGLTCEITYGPLKPLPCDGDDLVKRCISDCVKVGIIDAADAIWAANQVDMPHAYVVYDHARPANVKLIRDWLAGHGVHLAGRYSEWEYYNSDHAFLAGKKVAEDVKAALAVRPGTAVMARA